ncbi:hypothetical protein GGR58DRAFT_270583 [Xylaria digitata]|nr:hypothetical protein GGR58DRAFT_270583 [Xylaria digitata]
MRYKAIFLLSVLASYPASTACEEGVTALVIGREPSSIAGSTIAAPTSTASDLQFTMTTASPLETEPSLAAPAPSLTNRRRQHIIAARTISSPVTTLITTLPSPTPTPSTGGGDGTSDGSATGNSTIVITITRNRTTTIRPTVTVTSLFSSVIPTTSGASRCRAAPWASVSGLICILIFTVSLGAGWV